MKKLSALGRCVAALLLLAPPMLTRAQNVGIGISTPTQTLDVNGNVRVRGTTGTGTRLLQADATGIVSPAATSYPATGTFVPTLASTTTGLNNPLVAVSGTLAVVLNRGAGTLSLYDVSNPAALVLRGTATGISGGVKVAMNGASAAVLCSGSPYVVQLYTLGSGAPALATTLTPPNSLVNPFAGIAMTATRLYAAFDRGGSYGYFYVYDVSNPAAAVAYNQAAPCNTCPTGNTGNFTPQNVAAAGNLAAVSNAYAGATVLDVSDPTTPRTVGSTGAPGYNGADQPIALTTGALCMLTIPTAQLSTYSLSAAGVPTLRNTFTTGTTPVSVALNGDLAYVACRGTNTLQVVDVSGATAVLRGTIALDASANNVAATNTVTLAANASAANNLQAFSLPTRTVAINTDGSVTTVPTATGTDFIQNQTTTAQSASFNISGSAVVGSTLAVGVLNNFAGGTSAAPLALGTKAASYLSLRPTAAGTDDYFQLPAAATCPGRLYYLCNVGAVTANLTSAGGSLVRAATGAGGSPFAMPSSSAGRTVLAISDGVNWTIGTLN